MSECLTTELTASHHQLSNEHFFGLGLWATFYDDMDDCRRLKYKPEDGVDRWLFTFAEPFPHGIEFQPEMVREWLDSGRGFVMHQSQGQGKDDRVRLLNNDSLAAVKERLLELRRFKEVMELCP